MPVIAIFYMYSWSDYYLSDTPSWEKNVLAEEIMMVMTYLQTQRDMELGTKQIRDVRNLNIFNTVLSYLHVIIHFIISKQVPWIFQMFFTLVTY